MAKGGFFLVHRKFEDHPFWKERRVFSKAEAWLDIIWKARWQEEPAQIMIKGTVYECKRGECYFSMGTWADRWLWSKMKVKRFLDVLRNMNQIRYESVTHTIRLTVCNYDKYQTFGYENVTQVLRERDADEVQQKEVKELK